MDRKQVFLGIALIMAGIGILVFVSIMLMVVGVR